MYPSHSTSSTYMCRSATFSAGFDEISLAVVSAGMSTESSAA